jgi:hypothetical protein
MTENVVKFCKNASESHGSRVQCPLISTLDPIKISFLWSFDWSFHELQKRQNACGENLSPRDGQVDMEEVMGWLLARTPTPCCHGTYNCNSTVTASTFTSPSRPSDNMGCSCHGTEGSLRKDHIQQLSISLKTPTCYRHFPPKDEQNMVNWPSPSCKKIMKITAFKFYALENFKCNPESMPS